MISTKRSKKVGLPGYANALGAESTVFTPYRTRFVNPGAREALRNVPWGGRPEHIPGSSFAGRGELYERSECLLEYALRKFPPFCGFGGTCRFGKLSRLWRVFARARTLPDFGV